MEWLQSAWAWLAGGGGLAIVTLLLAISEFLGMFDKVKANSVYQAIRDGIVWLYGQLKK